MNWLVFILVLQAPPGVYFDRVLTEEDHQEYFDRFIVEPSPNTAFLMSGNLITVQPKTGAARAAQIVHPGLQRSFYFYPDPLGLDDDFDAYAYRREP